MTSKLSIKFIMLIALLASLSACGGGGGSGGGSTTGSSNWDEMVWDQDNWA